LMRDAKSRRRCVAIDCILPQSPANSIEIGLYHEPLVELALDLQSALPPHLHLLLVGSEGAAEHLFGKILRVLHPAQPAVYPVIYNIPATWRVGCNQWFAHGCGFQQATRGALPVGGQHDAVRGRDMWAYIICLPEVFNDALFHPTLNDIP